jgi:N6-L-threonylcarbamoyladenine synthase
MIPIDEIDLVAYTENPGLAICLQVGKIVAETISLFTGKPLLPCNHLEGHICSSLINNSENWEFPALAIVLSGGHTQIYMVKNYSEFTLLGETLDDAIGECLDKSSMLMGHDYPGGPVIERLALTGSDVYRLPFPKNDKSLDFSFSGMKSEISKLMMRGKINLNNLSFSIQKRLAEIVIKKLENAFEKFNNSFKTLIVGGGVISNRFLRKRILENIDKKHPLIRVFFPAPGYSTDNAAMIGVLAHYKLKNSIK